MRQSLGVAFVTILALIAVDRPATAHHSANAEFNTQQRLTLSGVLTKEELINPHSWLYLDVKAPDGQITHWKLESLSPAGLIRQGLRWKDDVRIGETYTFTYYPSWKDQDGPKLGLMRSIFVSGKEWILNDI